MKKLNKLVINPEKVMKNEELKTLRGGYDPNSATSFFCYYKTSESEPNVLLGCITFSTCVDSAFDTCLSRWPNTNQMGHSCGVYTMECQFIE